MAPTPTIIYNNVIYNKIDGIKYMIISSLVIIDGIIIEIIYKSCHLYHI